MRGMWVRPDSGRESGVRRCGQRWQTWDTFREENERNLKDVLQELRWAVWRGWSFEFYPVDLIGWQYAWMWLAQTGEEGCGKKRRKFYLGYTELKYHSKVLVDRPVFKMYRVMEGNWNKNHRCMSLVGDHHLRRAQGLHAWDTLPAQRTNTYFAINTARA